MKGLAPSPNVFIHAVCAAAIQVEDNSRLSQGFSLMDYDLGYFDLVIPCENRFTSLSSQQVFA